MVTKGDAPEWVLDTYEQVGKSLQLKFAVCSCAKALT